MKITKAAVFAIQDMERNNAEIETKYALKTDDRKINSKHCSLPSQVCLDPPFLKVFMK